MNGAIYFGPDAFRFLTELSANNDRAWFLKNKTRYEIAVRDPFLRLIADLGAPLRKFDPQLVVDPRPIGGSMMRIYRDIRFSRDKSPYKTSVAAHFGHKAGKESSGPAYYIHFEPGHSMVGAGVWRPEADALKQIRDAIVANAKRWQRVTSGAEFRSSCGMMGESLKRPPTGYDPEHPLIEDLKRKDFAISAPVKDREVVSDELLDTVVARMRSAAPFVKFLAAAVGLE
jgi:uncharacterized protein (TIGR02453 family)